MVSKTGSTAQADFLNKQIVVGNVQGRSIFSLAVCASDHTLLELKGLQTYGRDELIGQKNSVRAVSPLTKIVPPRNRNRTAFVSPIRSSNF